MKKKKYVILAVILVVCALTLAFAACQKKDDHGRIILRVPQNVGINGDTLSWDEVKNASGYIVKMGETVLTDEIPSTKTTYAVPSDVAEGSFSVAAKGDGKEYADSGFGGPVAFKRLGQLVAPSDISVDEGAKKVTWSAVSGASGYKVYVKVQGNAADTETVYDTTETQFDLTRISDEPQIYEISVSTVSASSDFADSGRSGIKRYIIHRQLAAPQNFVFSGNDNYIKWDSVPHASKYLLTISKMEGESAVSVVNQTFTGTSLQLTSKSVKIADPGKYKIEIKSVGSIDGVYTDSGYSETKLNVVRLKAVEGVSFNGLTASWSAYSDANVSSDTTAEDYLEPKVSVVFKNGSTTVKTHVVESGTTLDASTVTDLTTSTNIGKIYDVYFKVDGNGKGVLPSEEVKSDYTQGYLSYNASLSPTTDGIYEIANAGDLGFAVMNADKNYSFKLTANINLSSADWRSIGGNGGFSGTFDGNGYVISNFTIGNRESNNSVLGLFSTVNNGSTVKNLSVLNCTVKGVAKSGIIAGVNNGTIEFCNASGKVTGDNKAVNGGGIAGENGGNIKYCFANAQINFANAGGITAINSGSVTGCGSYGTINSGLVASAASKLYAGGLVGHNKVSSTVSDSFSNVIVNANGTAASGVNVEVYSGGFVGYNGGSINNSYASAGYLAMSSGAAYAGGFAGFNAGTITDAYATGSLVSGGNANSGGFVGKNASGATISNAFATGVLKGEVKRVGYFASDNAGSIVNSFYYQKGVLKGCAVSTGSGAPTAVDSNIIDAETTATILGSAFIKHSASQTGKHPVLANMVYLGIDNNLGVTLSQHAEGYSYSNVYFNGTELAVTTAPSTEVKGDFVAVYQKTVGDKIYRIIRFVTVK